MDRPALAFPRADDAGRAGTLIAHRGVPALHPENGASSLVAARDLGAPMVEFDVRATSDGLLVVLHDRTPARLTGAREPAVRTPARTLIAQRYRDAPSESLLLLDEALALLAFRTLIDVEIKPDPEIAPEDLARRTVEALVRAGSPPGAIVTSEDECVLRAVRACAPRLPTGLVFRSTDTRDAVRIAIDVDASVIAASRRRADARLVARAQEQGVAVWAYTIEDLGEAERVLALGCSGIFVNDYPRFRAALENPERVPDAIPRDEPRVLAIDLGSTTMKAALISPRWGILTRRTAPTPTTRSGASIEHDALAVVETARALVETLALADRTTPRAAAIASQRSTGLWTAAGAPLTPAVSWRDPRGESVVAELESRREELEREAGLPLAPAWTAVLGRALLAGRALRPGEQLAPLGAFVASALTGSPLEVDPTLANRMFLMEARRARWSARLLDAFGYDESALPHLRPTVAVDRAALPWPAGGRVPLAVLAGDQPCAYAGAVGPTGRHLVINIGTAAFVMRASDGRGVMPREGRRGPLWTSKRSPDPAVFLDEFPVIAPPAAEGMRPSTTSDDAARQSALDIAFGLGASIDFVERIANAAARMRLPPDQSCVLTGGGAGSPHLVKLLTERLPLPASVSRESETTLLGAGRLACAAIVLVWSHTRDGFVVGNEP